MLSGAKSETLMQSGGQGRNVQTMTSVIYTKFLIVWPSTIEILSENFLRKYKAPCEPMAKALVRGGKSPFASVEQGKHPSG